MGENCANYLAKGRLVGVQGRLQSGRYEKDGRTVYTTDVVAMQVEFLEWGDKKDNTNSNDFNSEEGFYSTDNDDMIPF